MFQSSMVYIRTTPVTLTLVVSTEAPWSQNQNSLYLVDAWRKLPNNFLIFSWIVGATDSPVLDFVLYFILPKIWEFLKSNLFNL